MIKIGDREVKPIGFDIPPNFPWEAACSVLINGRWYDVVVQMQAGESIKDIDEPTGYVNDAGEVMPFAYVRVKGEWRRAIVSAKPVKQA